VVELMSYGLTGLTASWTEPFNLYLEMAFVGGLFVASPFVFYQLWLFIAPRLYQSKALCYAVLAKYGRFVHGRGTLRVQDGLPCAP
jgi:sec-independent protein translocase protein TatC